MAFENLNLIWERFGKYKVTQSLNGCYDNFLTIFNLVPTLKDRTINNSEKSVSKMGRIGGGPLPKPLQRFPCHSNLVISISNFPTLDCAKFKYCSSDYPKGF